MKLIRVLTEVPAEAASLVALLKSRGFLVQTSNTSDLFSPSVDLEIDLRTMRLEAALHIGHRVAPADADAFVLPNILTEPVLAHKPSPMPRVVGDVSCWATYDDDRIVDSHTTVHPEGAASRL